jgi:peptidyl-prolyl cis-trans isomerase A (cyclophilin A)
MLAAMSTRPLFLVALAAPLVLAGACKKSAQLPPAAPPQPAAAPPAAAPPSLDHRDWAPNGADRFYNLVQAGYYNDTRFFRVVRGFMAQIGIHGKPELNAIWREQQIPDDPVVKSNTRGFVSFATAGPGTRTTQFFINYDDGNSRLDTMGFSPFGKVTSGMEVVDSLYAEYGEGAPQGRGPNQGRIQGEGNAYLMRDFPQLDYVKEATVVP